MATLDGMDLATGALNSGGAFRLDRTSPISTIVAVGDWRAEVSVDSSFIVVRGAGGARSYRAVLHSSSQVAQKALDILAATGSGNLQTISTQDTHVVWWTFGDGLTVRYHSTSTMQFSVGPITLVVKDKDGNVLPPTPVEPPPWHPSMRFWRQAQLATDVFDSMRSLWLAVENILDEIAPKGNAEKEGDWVVRAFEAIDGAVQLGNYLPPANSSPRGAYSYFYDQVRSSLFHAKASRNPVLPHDPEARLRERHERLSLLYLAILERHTGVRFMRSSFSDAAYAAVFDRFRPGLRVLVTADLDRSLAADQINPSGAPAASARMDLVPSLCGTDVMVVLGRLSAGALDQIPQLGKIWVTNDAAPVIVDVPDFVLETSEISRFHYQFAMRLSSRSHPKTFIDH